MKTAAKIVVAGVSTLALAGGIGAGIAYADPPSPTPTPTTSASPTQTPTTSASPTQTAQPRNPDQRHPRKKRPLALLAKALHGEVTLARMVVFQRGPVEKLSDTSLTVKSADGYTSTYLVSAETKVRKDEDKATIADLKTGDRVLVVADKDGSTLKAFRIRAKD